MIDSQNDGHPPPWYELEGLGPPPPCRTCRGRGSVQPDPMTPPEPCPECVDEDEPYADV